jgi:hypothetical protein
MDARFPEMHPPRPNPLDWFRRQDADLYARGMMVREIQGQPIRDYVPFRTMSSFLPISTLVNGLTEFYWT